MEQATVLKLLEALDTRWKMETSCLWTAGSRKCDIYYIIIISKYYSSEKKKQSNCLSWENCMELKVIMSSEISQVQQDHPWFYWSVESEIGERGVVIARGWGYLCGQQMEQVNQGPPGYGYLGARNSGVPFHSRVILINNIILCISKSRRKKMNAFTIMKQ